MITSLFLSIPPGTTYDQLGTQLNFVEDFAGVSNWVMRTPRIIYGTDLRSRHVFTSEGVQVERVNQPNIQERWKYFVITKGDGRRFYCTAQVYYERGPLKVREGGLFQQARQIYRQFLLPKCLVLLSDYPYYKIQVNLLKVFKELRRQQPIISHKINQNLYRVYLQLVDEGREAEWENIIVNESKPSRKINPSIQFTFNYYLSMCNEHRTGEAIFIQKNTNREVLHLYKLQTNSFYQLGYFFHLPFSPPTLRFILSSIFQQKQIIFTSNNTNLTTLVIQTLMRMILPFKWCYMYVPNLPAHLIEPAQQSFMPYLVGISKKNLPLIDTTERVVVYIQEDKYEYAGEVLLFHSSLSQNLVYVNSDSKNYLEWQKEIRIKSLTLIHSIIQDCIHSQSSKNHRSLHQSIVSLGGRDSHIRSMQRMPSFPHMHEETHSAFIEELVTNSMMYKHYKEDIARKLTEQTHKIIQIPRDQRKAYLSGRFHFLSMQAQYPARYDNEKKWICYYDRINNQRRKYRFNRYSLNMSEGGMLRQSIRMPTSNSLISSSRLLNSRILTQSTIFH